MDRLAYLRDDDFKVMRSALVTGGSGYIGSRLVRRLIKEGWFVHAVLRPASHLGLLSTCLGEIEIYRHKGTTDEIVDIISVAKPDVVFHLASVTSDPSSDEEFEEFIRSNIIYPIQLVEGMKRSKVRNLVTTESFWQYESGSGRFDPVSLYAATKQAFRDVLHYYANSNVIHAISLVLFDTYGPGDPRPKLLNSIKRAILDDRPIDLSPGEQIIDLTHVDDVVAAYLVAGDLLLGNVDWTFDTYAVTSGRRMSLKALLELVVRETGLPIRANWGGRNYRPNEVMVPWLGESLPGWRPKVDLESGLRDFFLNHDYVC